MLSKGHKDRARIEALVKDPTTASNEDLNFLNTVDDRSLYEFIIESIKKLSTKAYASDDFKNYFNSVMKLLNSVRDTKLDRQAR